MLSFTFKALEYIVGSSWRAKVPVSKAVAMRTGAAIGLDGCGLLFLVLPNSGRLPIRMPAHS
ncbi:hypothetical protein ACJQWK_06649 [Exserohilum turcicum]|uniref:Uncharacterized protein n=1 Tax=Exserohilum turcicum (strain 28A) TaxID=671987 RepID=R0JW28_EXST2|nr:uncharacterized protein SETTUDRAFT_154733 [Exserohilum turcica Et28A]EOA85143.1 hypothetical protein SETTUDRAFT_154733 [Exserohilum turcica Et28A]